MMATGASGRVEATRGAPAGRHGLAATAAGTVVPAGGSSDARGSQHEADRRGRRRGSSVVFLLQNAETAKIRFLFLDGTYPLWSLLVVGAALGLRRRVVGCRAARGRRRLAAPARRTTAQRAAARASISRFCASVPSLQRVLRAAHRVDARGRERAERPAEHVVDLMPERTLRSNGKRRDRGRRRWRSAAPPRRIFARHGGSHSRTLARASMRARP